MDFKKEISSYEIKYSKRRKTVTLEIDPAGTLVVHAPYGLKEDFIDKIVKEKQAWITKKLEKFSDNPYQAKKYVEGEEFFFLGDSFPLKLVNSKYAIKFSDNSFKLSKDCLEYAEEYFTLWYKTNAKSYFSKRIIELSNKTGLQFRKLGVTNANRRWGSCSSDNNINLSWRLVMAPKDKIDYVIIHELAHTIQKDHSDKFWSIVEKHDPKYRESVKWFKENGHLLDL